MTAHTEDTYFHIGPTFRIRETRAEDIPVWYKWFNDPEVTQYMIHGLIPNTIEAQEKFRYDHIGGSSKIIFSIVALDSPELIGTCSINMGHPASAKRGEVSLVIGAKNYRVGPVYWGITAWQLDHAFFQLNLNSVFAATHEENKVVQQTLERMGLQQCAVMRQVSYKDGRYWDSVWYDLLRSEWETKRSPLGTVSS